MVKQLSELERLKMENSNLQFQIAEYRVIVAELSDQLKEYKKPIRIKKSVTENQNKD